MQTTLLQKIELFFIYLLLAFFSFLEKTGTYIYVFAKNSFRFLAAFIIFGILSSVSTSLLAKPGEMLDSFFYYPIYPNYGLEIREQLPKKITETASPFLTAESAIAVDVRSGKVLFELNPDNQYPPASTTKVMTYLVANELYEPDDKIVISPFCTTIDSTKAGFVGNEVVSVMDLYYALLINSAGDAACALSYGKQDFIELMNKKALNIGLSKTKFSNAIGLDFYDGQVSTARDLALLGMRAMKDPNVKKISQTKQFTSSSSSIKHVFNNTNRLLWEIPETTGLKTGTTDGAGEVLIYFYEKDTKNIAVVVMKSSDRFGDTKKILDWVLTSYSWDL